jgi:hypothetical protein
MQKAAPTFKSGAVPIFWPALYEPLGDVDQFSQSRRTCSAAYGRAARASSSS